MSVNMLSSSQPAMGVSWFLRSNSIYLFLLRAGSAVARDFLQLKGAGPLVFAALLWRVGCELRGFSR